MQPYFLPYIGYFQLLSAVDLFVVYDEIEYTKKGWINRNRFLQNGKDEFFSLPLKSDSDFLHVNKRVLADTWNRDKVKILNKIRESYRKAPFFGDAIRLIEQLFDYPDTNLFRFVFNSIENTKCYLSIETPMLISSTLECSRRILKGQDRVLAICKELGATEYINPIGGTDLYSSIDFDAHGIALKFLKPAEIVYNQFENPFVSKLSILDVMMFNSLEEVKMSLKNYQLISV